MAEKVRPLYQQIYDDILAGLQRGTWKAGDQLPAEKELAVQYHVSRITCKTAMEMLTAEGYIQRKPGRGTFVLDRTPAPGTTSADRSEASPSTNPTSAFIPEPVSTAIIGGKQRPLLIGLILPDFDETYGTSLLSGVEKAAADNGAFLILRRSYDDQEQEERSLEDVLLLGVDGIIIMPVHGEHYAPKILQLVLDKFPLVFVDRHLRGLNAPFVGTDNAGAAKKATDYLFGIGHRKIGFLTPPYAHTTAIEDRLEGFIKSHTEHGVSLDTSVWLTNITATLPGRNLPHIMQKDIAAIQDLLVVKPDITCLFAAEYNIALLAAEAIKAHGMRLPQDISLLCFDSPSNFMKDYSFTHIKQRETDMGETAVRLLYKQIRHESGPTGKLFLDTDLVVGFSTISRPAV